MEQINKLKKEAFEIAMDYNNSSSLRLEAMKTYAQLCLVNNSFETRRMVSNLLRDLIQKEKQNDFD